MFQLPASIIVFLTGLAVGSFLNCAIYRLSLPGFSLKNLAGLKERSFCPQCKHILGWQDLIPLFSFLILKGKCRYCQQKISWQYPLVEISTGLIFLLIFNLRSGQPLILNFLDLVYYWLISSFLIIIFVYDLKHFIIPDAVIYPAVIVAFVYRLFLILNYGLWNSDFKALINPLASAVLASSFFLAIVLVSRGRWMGGGDIKLAFFMGLFLGFPDIFFALFSAFFIGAIIGIGLIISGKKTLKSEIPFGPFLVTGICLSFFFGEKIIDWYLNLFL